MSPGEEIIGIVAGEAKKKLDEAKEKDREEERRKEDKKNKKREDEERRKEEARTREREYKTYEKQAKSQQRGLERQSRAGSRASNYFRNVGNEMKNSPGATVFFLVALAIHFFDFVPKIFPFYFRLLIYTLLGFWAYFLFRDSVDNILRDSIIISAVIIFIPYTLSYFPRNVVLVLSRIIIFAPIWPLYIYFRCRVKGLVQVIGGGYVLFCIALLLFNFFSTQVDFLEDKNIPIDSYKPIRDFTKQVKEMFRTYKKATVEAFTNFPQKIDDWWTRSMEYATGGYYAGQEEPVEEPLGVFLEDVETTLETYYEFEPITIWGTLRAKSIGKRGIPVTVGCGIDNWREDEAPPDIIIEPKAEFTMEGYDQVDIDCNIREGLPESYYDVTLNATFDYDTDARLLTYWIDENRYRAVTRQGKDIFEEYDIPEEEPIAYFSSGPVAVGIGVGKPPIIVGDTAIRPRLGITVENNWMDGDIAKIDIIEIFVPEDMELDLESCSENVQREGTKEGFKIYRMFGDEGFENIDNYVTVICRFKNINPSILDPTPVTLRYIKAKVYYKYVVSETVEVEVECPPEGCLEDIEEEEEEVVEVDVGRDYKNKGVCIDSQGPRYDSCLNEEELIEYFKYEEVCGYEKIKCSTQFGSSWECKNGACVEKEIEEDTDCASKGCCKSDLGGTCIDPCNAARCPGGSCIPGFCSGGETRVCCVLT